MGIKVQIGMSILALPGKIGGPIRTLPVRANRLLLRPEGRSQDTESAATDRDCRRHCQSELAILRRLAGVKT
jgi:hypothetical protein